MVTVPHHKARVFLFVGLRYTNWNFSDRWSQKKKKDMDPIYHNFCVFFCKVTVQTFFKNSRNCIYVANSVYVTMNIITNNNFTLPIAWWRFHSKLVAISVNKYSKKHYNGDSLWPSIPGGICHFPWESHNHGYFLNNWNWL